MKHVAIMFLPFMLERVRAGTKTQTRRPVKFKKGVAVLRYAVGDLLWVKEKTREYPNKRCMPKRLAKTWLEVVETYLEPVQLIT